ncbi:hypothetical protein BJX99DRAFT_266815 [Aspergillus californicus]
MTLQHDDYTVAWICALPLEMAGAKVMLDETHELLSQPPTDHNTYTLGRRASHNAVIACLPSGVYGTTSATIVLSHMLPTFPYLRFGLLVGIGGGVPSGSVDVRLGDVVVGIPNTTSGGVIQYGYGKSLRDGQFQRTGMLNKPPQFLLTAVPQIRSGYMMGERPFEGILSSVLQKYHLMQGRFSPPDEDWLFESTYDHQSSYPDCSKCTRAQLVNRVPRTTKVPYVHYGLIASGNQVIKNAKKRDSLAKAMDILCFEMEAAGIVDQLPCLVIRGICDYSRTLLEIVPTPHRVVASERQDDRKCHWMVPFQKNMGFIGRDDEISKIEGFIDGPPCKTQVALEVAYRMRERFSCSIFWIPCTSSEIVQQAYMNIAHTVGIRDKEAGRWLLIFDNADSMDMWIAGSTESLHETDYQPLTEYFPQNEHGHILFTTRNRAAAAYINTNDIELTEYIALLQEQESDVIELLIEDFGDEGRYKDIQNPVATTWLISFHQIQKLNQLAPRAIPQSLLPPAASKMKEIDAIGILKAFSFVNGQTGHLNLHRLVHLSTRNWLRVQQQFRQQVHETASQFNRVFPTDNHKNRKLWREYLPHVLSLIEENGFQHEQYMDLVSRVGCCLCEEGKYKKSANLFEYILKIQTGLQGDTHPTTLHYMDCLASAYYDLGRYNEAKNLEVRILEVRMQHLGSEHQTTLDAMNGLSLAYSRLEKLDEVEKIRVQILESRRRSLGPKHPDTLHSMHNLSSTYLRLGRVEEAERLEIEVLEVIKGLFGLENPVTLDAMSLLSGIYIDLGRVEESGELRQQTVETSRRVLGPEHPTTLREMYALAYTWCYQGKIQDALFLMEKCAELYKKVIGPDQRHTKSALRLLEKLEKANSDIKA